MCQHDGSALTLALSPGERENPRPPEAKPTSCAERPSVNAVDTKGGRPSLAGAIQPARPWGMGRNGVGKNDVWRLHAGVSIRRKLIISTLVVSLLGAALLWFALDGSRESVYCQRGTWDFWTGITEPVIKNFPTPKNVSGLGYHWGCGDGPKYPDQAVYYRSSLSVSELLALAQPHIEACGYRPKSTSNTAEMLFARGRKSLYLEVKSADDGNTQLHAEVTFELW